MTRLAAQILGQLQRGPYTVLDLAIALDERTQDVKRELAKLEAADVVEHTLDGWQLVSEVAA